MTGRYRTLALQAVGVAAIAAIIFFTFLRPDTPGDLSGIEAPGSSGGPIVVNPDPNDDQNKNDGDNDPPERLTVSVALFAGAPSAASAQDCTVPSPTQDQYCPPSTTIEQGSDDPSDPSAPSAPSAPSDASGGLPFTGYDMGFAALAAVALIGAGFGLRRAARTDV